MIWLNGQTLPDDQAKVSIYDQSVMYGMGAFEMLRTFNGAPFKVDEHLDRLWASAKHLGIEIPYEKREIKSAHYRVVQDAIQEFPKGEEVRTLIKISPGLVPIYGETVPWVMISATPLSWTLRGFSHYYKYGVHAVTPSQRQIPAHLLDPKVKNHCRIHYKLAEQQARQVDSLAWPLLLDENGFITEASGANFFIVHDKIIVTPDRNILDGISRHFIVGLLPLMPMAPFFNLEPYDVLTADEAFFTATPFCIVSCTRFNGKPIGNGEPGPITKKLTQAWIDMVGCDFVKQVDRWANA